MDNKIIRGKIIRINCQKNDWFGGTLLTYDPVIKRGKIKPYNRQFISINGFYSGLHNLQDQYVILEGNFETNIVNEKVYKNFKIKKISLIKDDIIYNFIKEFIGIFNDEALQEMVTFKKYELIEWLNNNNKFNLIKIKGIGEKKVQNVLDKWEKHKDKLEFFEILGNTFNSTKIEQIYKYYIFKHQYNVKNIIKILKNNPYKLLEVDGLGFKSVDKFALSIGISKTDPIRIEEYIKYRANFIMNNIGNTILKYKELEHDTTKNIKDLDIDLKLFQFNRFIKRMINKQNIILFEYNGEKVLIFKHILEKEKKILDILKNKSRNNNYYNIDNIDNYIENKEKKIGIQYSEQQKLGIKAINDNNVVIIRGYAGTGKSFISKTILDMFVDNNIIDKDDIIVTALSGIATDRVRKYSGYKGDTILGLIYKKEHKLEKSDKLKYKFILIDEASMINLDLFYSILNKINNDCKIVIVGDPGQLQPIGLGDIFNDIINLQTVPVITFNEIYRNNNYEINKLANDIRQHIVPSNYKDINKFEFINLYNNYNAINDYLYKNNIIKEQQNLLNSGNYIDYIENLQIISPKKRGAFGIIELNIYFKNMFNPSNLYKEFKYTYNNKEYKYRFSIGDKVVHKKNTILNGRKLHKTDIIGKIYDTSFNNNIKVFNGMIGIISYIDMENEYIYVMYPIENIIIRYDFRLTKTYLELGYVITVHKSQGSGFNHIIYIQDNFQDIPFYNNKLLYTAITRMKNRVTIFSKNYVFEKTILNKHNINRLTFLKYLKNYMEKHKK